MYARIAGLIAMIFLFGGLASEMLAAPPRSAPLPPTAVGNFGAADVLAQPLALRDVAPYAVEQRYHPVGEQAAGIPACESCCHGRCTSCPYPSHGPWWRKFGFWSKHGLPNPWISTRDMPPHVPYIAEPKNYYYQRPYNWFHIAGHQAEALRRLGDPRNPYDNRFFQRIYEEVEHEHSPPEKVPSPKKENAKDMKEPMKKEPTKKEPTKKDPTKKYPTKKYPMKKIFQLAAPDFFTTLTIEPRDKAAPVLTRRPATAEKRAADRNDR